MDASKARNGRKAIELMSAWAGDPDGDTDFLGQRLTALLEEEDDPLGAAIELIAGLVNLTGLLLVRRLSENGVTESQTLQEMGVRFAGE